MMTAETIRDWGYWVFDFKNPERLFGSSIRTSLTVHGFIWLLVWLIMNIRFQPSPAIEVDLTAPFRPRSPWDTRAPGRAKGIPAPAPVPSHGGKSPVPPSAKPPSILTPPPDAPIQPPVKEQPWILPGPNTKELIKPTITPPPVPVAPAGGAPGATGEGGEGGRGGSGGGSGTGDAIVNRRPRLINVEEIRSLLRRHYPISEREAGRSGDVVVGITITADGRVEDVQVLESAGANFDEAAKKVVRRMLFEPGLIRSVPSRVRVRQTVQFQIADQ